MTDNIQKLLPPTATPAKPLLWVSFYVKLLLLLASTAVVATTTTSAEDSYVFYWSGGKASWSLREGSLTAGLRGDEEAYGMDPYGKPLTAGRSLQEGPVLTGTARVSCRRVPVPSQKGRRKGLREGWALTGGPLQGGTAGRLPLRGWVPSQRRTTNRAFPRKGLSLLIRAQPEPPCKEHPSP